MMAHTRVLFYSHVPGFGAAFLNGHHEVVERAGEVLEDELCAGLLQPLAQLGLDLLLEADYGELLAREEPLHLRARLLVFLRPGCRSIKYLKIIFLRVCTRLRDGNFS